jgi:hypothetical protein
MNRLILLAMLCLSLSRAARADDGGDGDDDNEAAEELDFLDNDKAEEHRKAREADRAPAIDVFLEEDDEEDAPSWTTTAPPPGAETVDIDEDEELESSSFDGVDEDEDEDGDPMDDLSPADRASMMVPLGDNFPLSLVARGRGQVTVELPVLVAQDGRFGPDGYWLVAEAFVNSTQVAEARQHVVVQSIAGSGPTKVWFKLDVPVHGPEADLEVKVSQIPANSSRLKPLFSRRLSVRM